MWSKTPYQRRKVYLHIFFSDNYFVNFSTIQPGTCIQRYGPFLTDFFIWFAILRAFSSSDVWLVPSDYEIT